MTSRFRCDNCGEVYEDSEFLKAANPFDPSLVLTGCPGCKHAGDSFTAVCDEPGCQSDAGCGFPTHDGGYRWTCYRHMRDAEGER